MYYNNLADFIRSKMAEKKLSTYEVARESGNAINANTITRILNGDIKEAKLTTLQAIAKGLGVPEIDIFRVARGMPPETPKERLKLLAETFAGQGLTDEDWEEVDAMLYVLVEQKKRRITAAAAIDKFENEQLNKKASPTNNIFNEDPTKGKRK